MANKKAKKAKALARNQARALENIATQEKDFFSWVLDNCYDNYRSRTSIILALINESKDEENISLKRGMKWEEWEVVVRSFLNTFIGKTVSEYNGLPIIITGYEVPNPYIQWNTWTLNCQCGDWQFKDQVNFGNFYHPKYNEDYEPYGGRARAKDEGYI